MLVFREGRRVLAGPPLYRTFVLKLRSVGKLSGENLLHLLLEAGELECALADAASPVARRIECATDSLADSLVGGVPLRTSLPLDDSPIPSELTVSRPEGLAYYALHPLNYADAIKSMRLPSHLAVLGIRSIGTTLSAVVAAASRKEGRQADRITVRPSGHVWDRTLCFCGDQRQWIAERLRRGAQFVVVDEGPGLSGSSFLAVGEALVEAGVPVCDILLLGSAEPDVQALRAPDAAHRWKKFRFVAVPPASRIPDGQYFAEGKWREAIPGEWPGSWIPFERLKFRQRNSLFKFEGLGPYGSAVLDRARTLASAGFSPAAEPAGDGFVKYEWLQGTMPLRPSTAILDRIAEYCAWRVCRFASSAPADLQSMVASNYSTVFSAQFDGDLPLERIVIPDGKMQTYEWLDTGHRVLKFDAVDHGDDHFYPGPTDIAWDLAGAIVEWQLDPAASEYLLARYTNLSGDRARSRIAAYRLAYALYRYAYCRLAADSLRDNPEEKRLVRDAERYRAAARSSLPCYVAA